MSGFRFEDPWWFLLIPVVLLVFWWKDRKRGQHVFLFGNTGLLKTLKSGWSVRVRLGIIVVLYLGLLLLITALARPQAGREEFRVKTSGIAITMCLDRSGSMEAMDFVIDGERRNRLDVVKQIFRDFVLGKEGFAGRPDDLISVTAFGGYVDTHCPLTLDHESLAGILDSIKLPEPLFDSNGRIVSNKILEEESATAIGDALASCVETLKSCDAKSKVIILLSDGAQNTGVLSAQEGASLAKKYGIRVYTIGIGSNRPVPFPVYDMNGQRGYSRQILELDEQTLKKIAETTSGKYFHADNTDTLKNIYEEIDSLEKTEQEGLAFTKYNDLYRYFLIPGFFMVFGSCFLLQTRFRKIP